MAAMCNGMQISSRQTLNLLALVVYWEMEDKKIIQFVNGEEDLNVQQAVANSQSGPVLMRDQLFLGKAALQITDVKLQDAGVLLLLDQLWRCRLHGLL
ncbi:Programmed cell death 1 ligand 1 [Camelus dromedarius]|uniref:Programmed cell death 1 ligand 1 n=1 Tax=Camelus dromedarius TaxID=9838 RepID=A0A5N4E9L9_CAMDR|nr:Programmed cell death 1 ligand 1 [Camelus dromedarius]